MKKLLLIMLLANCITFSYSQEKTVYRRVMDSNKNPVSGALIEVLNNNEQTYSDTLGRFHLSIPKGKRSLLITHGDFKPKNLTLTGPYYSRPVYIKLNYLDNIPKNSAIPQKKFIKTLKLKEEFNKCYTSRNGRYSVDRKYKVLFVLTKTGDTVELNKENPGRIINTGVFGFPQKLLPFDAIDSTVFNKKSLESLWKNGVKYTFIIQDSSGYICSLPDTVNIPLAGIDLMQVKIQDNHAAGAAVIVAGATAGVVGVAMIIRSISRSISESSSSWHI